MKADAVQDFLQGFGPGLSSLLLAASGFPPLWGAVFRKYVDVDELKGAHFVVELPSPGPNRRLLDDIDYVSLLQSRHTVRFGSHCGSDKKKCTTVFEPMNGEKQDEAQKQEPNSSLTAVGTDAAQQRLFSEIKN